VTCLRGRCPGVPFLLKDRGALSEGDPYAEGVKAARTAGYRADHDSVITERFHAAGLVYIGRTNTPELGLVPTTEGEAYGPCRNPWDPGRSAGGSSGCSAAAVASGMVPVAHASDGGGSIRIPRQRLRSGRAEAQPGSGAAVARGGRGLG
jgi:amidase